jgi:hypothetical protein
MSGTGACPSASSSSAFLPGALDAVVRRVKNLDRKHDIPYLAGYSRDGKTIYIDRHMPSAFRYRGRDINTDRYLILHEEVEKTLIDQLGLHYLHAHQIATRAEQAAVRAAGILWRDYDRSMQKYVKTIGDERLTKVPADLDLKPYRDEHDYDLVKRMLACIARGEGPPGVTAEHVRRAVERHMPQLKHVKPKEPQVGCKRLLVGRPSAPPRAGRSHAARRVRGPGPF